MKVIYCLNQFPPDTLAGTEMYAYSLIRELAKAGVESLVVIPNFNSSETIEYVYDNINVCKYGETTKITRDVMFGKTLPNGILGYKKIIEKFKPEVIHFHKVRTVPLC